MSDFIIRRSIESPELRTLLCVDEIGGAQETEPGKADILVYCKGSDEPFNVQISLDDLSDILTKNGGKRL